MHFREFQRMCIYPGEDVKFYVRLYIATFPGRVATLLEELLQ